MKIKFTTHNEDTQICSTGTYFIGGVICSYDKLVEVFGKPMEGSYKTDAEWSLKFSDGEIATIYNWKNGRNYCGDDGMDVEEITTWHIGGRNSIVDTKINLLVGNIPLGDKKWIQAQVAEG
jgi:hypothetical protein